MNKDDFLIEILDSCAFFWWEVMGVLSITRL